MPVKADPSVDYYAELGISQTATDDEINKAYRKLAFKYHPDRNHGHEDEVQGKFQAISAAHDTLLDPDLRRKYDFARSRGSASGRPPPPARPKGSSNPYQATSAFAPPPRPPGFQQRPNPPRPPPPPPRDSTPSGANRYEAWGPNTAGRAPPNTGAKQGPKSRANVFNAWTNMGPTTKPPNARPNPAPPFRDSARPANERDSRPSSGGSDRSAFEEMNSNSYRRRQPPKPATERVPLRRGGFDPSSPTVDETQAPSAGYNAPRFNHDNHPKMDPGSMPPQAPPRPAPTARRPPHSRANSTDDAPYSEGLRERTPYFRGAGEKTYFFDRGSSIRRTTSVRDATKMHPGGVPVDSQFDRHRSLSPRHRSSAGSPPSRDGPKAQHRPYHSTSSAKPFMVDDDLSDSSSDSSEFSPGEDDEQTEAPRRRASYVHGANAANRPKATPGVSWSRRRDQSAPTTPLGKSRSLEEERMKSQGSAPDERSRPFDPKLSDVNGATGHQAFRAPEPHGAGFSADQWKQTDWTQTWTQANASPTRGNPRRGRAPASRPAQRTTPGAVTVEDVDRHLEKGDLPEVAAEAARAAAESSSSSTNNVHADPMDIDDDVPASTHHTRNGAPTPAAATRPAASPAPPPQVPQPSTRPNISLKDFGNVAPFASSTSGAGIDSLSDLSSTLPFASRASTQHPQRPSATQIELPKAPSAPLPPSNPSNRHAFEVYLVQLTDYMSRWNRYNSLMIAHFQDRAVEQAESEKGAQAGWVDNWLQARGETSDRKGWASYVRGQREDREWRSAWQEACERHAQAVEWHEKIRAQVERAGGMQA